MSLTQHETRLRQLGYQRIAGIDEAGRGPLAGPVVAAACILPSDELFPNIDDSKKLTPQKREDLFKFLTQHPKVHFGVGVVEVSEIDTLNILQASFLAMRRALLKLNLIPDYLIIDGPYKLKQCDIPQEGIVDGDALSVSIAAASIIAKVARDRIMEELDAKWPEYGFRRHKGYGTQEHLIALRTFGPCPIHRTSFAPIKNLTF